jgi:hypothetical protein
MKVQCIKNRGDQISSRYIEAGMAFEKTKYSLAIGEDYNVYGILVKHGLVLYLIVEGETFGVGYIPIWVPADLFRIIDNRLPNSMLYNTISNNVDEPISLWGYKELIEDIEHADRLTDGNRSDVEIFQNRKKEIDAG